MQKGGLLILAIACISAGLASANVTLKPGNFYSERQDDQNPPKPFALWQAALNSGDLKQAKALLKKGVRLPSLFQRDARIDLMLAAASSGRLEMVKFLEDQGLEVNVVGVAHETPLHRAAKTGEVQLIRYLLSKGCDPKAQSVQGMVPLLDAVRNPNPEVFQVLRRGITLSAGDKLVFLGEGARYSNDKVFPLILKSMIDPAEKGLDARVASYYAACYPDESTAIRRIKALRRMPSPELRTGDGNSLLYAVAECGHLKVAQFLINEGLNPRLKDPSGRSPAFAAIKSGKPEVVDFFLRKGLGANEKDSDGKSLLMEALAWNPHDFSIPALLIKGGADVNGKSLRGETALSVAAGSNDLASIQELFKAGAKPATKEEWAILLRKALSRPKPKDKVLGFLLAQSRGKIQINEDDLLLNDLGDLFLRKQLREQDFESAKLLVEAGASVQWPGLFWDAARIGDLRFIKLFADAGARFLRADDYFFALEHNVANPELLQYLFEHFSESKRELQDGWLQILLDDAAKAGAADSIRFLLEKGADPRHIDGLVVPPVFYAAESGNIEAVKLLLPDKKLLSFRDDKGNTVLTGAVSSGNVALVKELVGQGLDLKEENGLGLSLLDLAVSHNKQEMVEYLLENAESVDKRGRLRGFYGRATPLHIAAAARPFVDVKIVKSLLDAGADINEPDLGGRTPLLVALLSDNFELAAQFLMLGADPSIVDNGGRSALSEIKSLESSPWVSVRVLKEFFEAREKAFKGIWDHWVKSQQDKKGAHSGHAPPVAEGETAGQVVTEVVDPRSIHFSGLNHLLSDEALTQSLLLSAEDKEFPLEPPKSAPERLKRIYKNLKAARFTPEALTGESLEIEGAPVGYYREILKGASTIRAQSASRDGQAYVFNPTSEQARKVLNIMLSDQKATGKDLEPLAWLMVRSKMGLDAKLLEQFKIPEDQLKAGVDQMLLSDPFQYKGSSSFAAIKLIKALLSYPDESFACAEGDGGAGGSTKESKISRILNWFGNYGNNPDADRVFFAKLARLVLEKKKLCSRDRDILLSAMRDWRGTNAMVQNEIACAVSQSLGSAPLSGREIEEFTIISETVGLRSELNQGSWLEQMKAFGQLLAHHGGGELSGDEQEVYNGLLKFALGTPEGVVKRKVGGEEKKFFSFPKSDANGGQVVKLCKILKRMNRDKSHLSESEMSLASGASLWLQLTREKLDSARKWPEGFEAPGFDMKQTIREEMRGEPKLAADLVALETSCEVVPGGDGTPESYIERQARIKARQRSRPRTKKGNFDFSPAGS